MDYLGAMRAFVRVVDLGSFSRAAEEQELKVSTVSRYVSFLEGDLGAALLNRSTRSLHLTEAGAAFYERSVAILSEVEDARQATLALNARPQGVLRAAVPGAFGRHHIIPHLAAFQEIYPEIRLDIHLSEETVDLITTGMDVAIRIGVLADSSLVARKLAGHKRVVVCSRSYLDKNGTPTSPEDISQHRCLLFSLQAREAWFYTNPTDRDGVQMELKVHGEITLDDSDALLRAAIDGLGLALLPAWLTIDALASGELLPVLPNFDWAINPGPERAIWGIYPPKKTLSPKVRAFLDFIGEKVAKLP